MKIGQRVIGLDIDHAGGFAEELAIKVKVRLRTLFCFLLL
jgi:hypothetical protein